MRIYNTAALFFMLLLGSCSAVERERVPTASEIARLIKGTWCTPDKSGTGCAGYDYVIDERTAIACGKMAGSEEPFFAKSHYTIQENRICYREVESGDPRAVSTRNQFCAEILKINDTIEVYRFVGESREFSMRRVNSPPPCYRNP